MLEYLLGLNKIVQKRISQGYSYMETLRSLYGADPREVLGVFKKFKEESYKKSQKIGLKISFFLVNVL